LAFDLKRRFGDDINLETFDQLDNLAKIAS